MCFISTVMDSSAYYMIFFYQLSSGNEKMEHNEQLNMLYYSKDPWMYINKLK